MYSLIYASYEYKDRFFIAKTTRRHPPPKTRISCVSSLHTLSINKQPLRMTAMEEEDIIITGETPVEESGIDTQTQETYRAWKANAPALYDYLNTYNNVWPSLTVQFFPDKDW